MAEQRTPGQIFDELVQKASAAPESSPAPDIVKTVNDLAQTVAKQTEALTAVTSYIQAARTSPAPTPSAPAPSPQTSVTPWQELEQMTGVRDLGASIERAAAQGVEKAFEAQMAPVRKAQEAVQKYQEQHNDFNLPAFQEYLAKNPDVREVVTRAEAQGAYEAAIAYGELRRSMDTRIKSEAHGQVRTEKRGEFVRQTRPDAQIVGANGGSGGGGSTNVATTPLTQEQVAYIYAQADSGNWKPFEDTFINPTLPSEEWFQALAQS